MLYKRKERRKGERERERKRERKRKNMFVCFLICFDFPNSHVRKVLPRLEPKMLTRFNFC